MRVEASCPRCGVSAFFNGIGRCLNGHYLIAKPSPRRKSIDLRSKGPTWLWKPRQDGREIIVVRYAELDPEGCDRTVVTNERGEWQQIANGIIRLAPDYRRVGIDPLPFMRNVRHEPLRTR